MQEPHQTQTRAWTHLCCAKATSARVPNAARAGKSHKAKTNSHILVEGFPISQKAWHSPDLTKAWCQLCSSWDTKEKQKAAKCSRALELQGSNGMGFVMPRGWLLHRAHILSLLPKTPPHQSCSPHPRTTLQVSWRNSPLLETSPDLSRHPTSLIRLFSSPTGLLRLLENISQDLDSSQQRQQSLTFRKVCPKEVGAWPGPRNKPIYNPISPFITSLADGQTGQCCQSSGSQIIIIPSGFGSFSDILLLLRSENQLQITPSQFQKCPWPSRKPAP